MKALKNIVVGFAVSFIGSIPLGYLNIIGFQIDTNLGRQSLLLYLIGVVLIEAIVIYSTLLFADKLAKNVRLIKYIEVFSIVFMTALAFLFFFQSADGNSEKTVMQYEGYSPFLIGIVCSSLNFIQIPFWLGWNLFLVNSGYVATDKRVQFLFLAGTLVGTFFGMLAFVHLLRLLTQNSDSLSGYIMSYIIPLFFLGVAVLQSFKFYKKYHATSQTRK